MDRLEDLCCESLNEEQSVIKHGGSFFCNLPKEHAGNHHGVWVDLSPWSDEKAATFRGAN